MSRIPGRFGKLIWLADLLAVSALGPKIVSGPSTCRMRLPSTHARNQGCSPCKSPHCQAESLSRSPMGPRTFFPTDVLHDGRILFQAGYPLGTETIPELYTVYSDGSGVESYRCDHGSARHSGRQSSSGDIVFASAHGLSRFTSARAQQLPIAAPAGNYAGDIAETASGEWLLSWRPDAKSHLRIMRWSNGAKDLAASIRRRECQRFAANNHRSTRSAQSSSFRVA